MADETGISWADSTFNPWVGCSKVSPGCAHCYAENWAVRYADGAVWGDDGVRRRTSAALWRKPIQWEKNHEQFEAENGRRRRVFCASLADIFEPRSELDPWRDDLFEMIEETPHLDWLILTKRPEVARDFFAAVYYADPIPSNIWMGTSIENSRFTWRADVLREIPAALRFISAEPLLGSLYEDTSALRLTNPRAQVVGGRLDGLDLDVRDVSLAVRKPLDLTGIDWVIVGGESGAKSAARLVNPEWVREIRDRILAYAEPEPGYFDYGGPSPGTAGGWIPSRGGRPAFHFKQWGSHDADGVYRGPSPTSGRKLLDGVEWCEVPSSPRPT